MHLSLTNRAVIVALGGFAAWSTATTAQAQQIQTVFVIAMENHNLTQPNPLSNPQQIRGNAAAPFLNSLMTVGNPNATHTSFATNYQNVASGIHPSAPNYIWSQGGSNFGVLNDNDPFGAGGSAQTTSHNLSNYLQTAGITWKSYQEDIDINLTNNTVLPNNQWTVPLTSSSGSFSSGTNAYNGTKQYGYDVNHNPQVYFVDTNGGNNSTPSNPFAHNYAPLQQLQTDLANNTVARYNWITPSQYNDAHSSLPNGFTYHGTHYTGDQAAVAQGDNFLSIIIPQIEASQAYQNNGVIIIWFDETEGGDTPAWTIPEIIISPLAKGNAYSNGILYTHSSDLLTTEEIFGVGPCIGAACGANDLSDLFQPGSIGVGPTLSSISPSTGSQGSSVSVTLAGTGFVAPVTVNVGGTGVTVSNVAIVSSTQINATFNITANAATGGRNVSVTTTAGTSATTPFTVNAASTLPTLTSVAPSSGSLGTSVNVTLTGTNFTAASQVRLQGVGLTQTNIVVVSATQITATYNISSSVALGAHNTWVVTSGGSSNMLTFTVTAAGSKPTLTSVAPNSGVQGTAVNITLAGTNFIAGATVGVAGSGITASNVSVASSTQITATLNIAANAAPGAYPVSVTTTGGTSNTAAFTVTGASSLPTLTSVTPSSGARGTSVNVTLTGTNFTSASSVRLQGVGLTQTNIVVVSPTQITATYNISSSVATGPHNTWVVTGAGSSNILTFTVN